MTAAVYLFLYLGFITFVVAALVRTVRYVRLPVPLRWELYPVPHEDPQRAAYGGSYFETGEWWRQKRPFHLAGEFTATVAEIATFRTLREFNRRLWQLSFLFHLGLYLLIAALVLLLINSLFGLSRAPYGLLAVARVYQAMGVIGTVCVLAGAAGLLARRMGREFRNYTAPADIFNLVFFIVTVALVGAGYWVRPPGSASMVEIVRGLLLFNTTVEVPRFMGLGLIFAAVLIAYIPLTHMGHFIAKYFAFHGVRWNDASNTGRMQARVAQCLAYRPTWNAAHLAADGQHTWAEIVRMDPTRAVRQ